MERQFLTKQIRNYLDDEEIVLAIIRAATDLQQLLTEMLFFKKDVKFKLVERWGLEQLILWNETYEFIDKKQVPLLNLFKKLRNIVFHRRTFMEKILQNNEDKKIVKNIILSVCSFMDNTKIRYPPNQEIEKEYSKLLKKIEDKYENFLSDYYNLFPKLEDKNDLQ